MKKVLFVATVAKHIEGFHTPYLKLFKENGYEVHVASNNDMNGMKYCDKYYDIGIKRSPIKLDNLRAIKKLRKIINEEEYDIVHCHTPMGGVIARIASYSSRKKNNTKVIYTAHGFHFYKGAPILNWIIYYPIEKLLSFITDKLIAINEEDYNFALKKLNAKETFWIKGVGVNVNKFKKDILLEEKQELYEELDINTDDFIIIQVGELNKNKNQKMTIEAINKLSENFNNIKVLFAGKGPLVEEYTNLVNQYNINEKIRFLGYRNDVDKLMKISNILISTSFREGLPVNLIEAMASGLPIVCTNCRGNRELVKNDINGYVVEINDVDNMVEKVSIILKDSEKFKNFKENSLKLVDNYSLDSIMTEMKKIYEIR